MTIRGLRATCRPADRRRRPDRLALHCGEDSREIAGLPIDLIAQAIEPTEPQRAALDELANASVTSAQKIKAACPTTVALTASGRLVSMQQRIEGDDLSEPLSSQTVATKPPWRCALQPEWGHT
jgi:hypothetical protein